MLYWGTLITLFIFCGKDITRLATETVGIVMDCFANFSLFMKKVVSGTEHRYKQIVKSSYRKFAVLITISVIPTFLVGIIGKELIESASNSSIIIGAGLLVGGTLLLIGDILHTESNPNQNYKTPKHVTYVDALLVGIAQSLSLLPGISCVIIVYVIAIWRDFRKDFAMKYSLIMLFQTSCINIMLNLEEWNSKDVDVVNVFAALVTLCGAVIISFIVIRGMQLIIQKNILKYFAYFCYGVGVIKIISQIINSITV